MLMGWHTFSEGSVCCCERREETIGRKLSHIDVTVYYTTFDKKKAVCASKCRNDLPQREREVLSWEWRATGDDWHEVKGSKAQHALQMNCSHELIHVQRA